MMNELERKYFKANYFHKIYDLMLMDVYASTEDFMVEKETFNNFFNNTLKNILLENAEAVTETGIIMDGIEYRNYDDIDAEWFKAVGFDEYIKSDYGIPENVTIYEQHPNWVMYIPVNGVGTPTKDFFEAVSSLTLQKDKSIESPVLEER